MISKEVYTFHTDASGLIWTGKAGGLSSLDPGTGAITHFTHGPENPGSISNDNFGVIFEDALGVIWVDTAGGLNKLDRKTGSFTHYVHDPNDPAILTNDQVTCV